MRITQADGKITWRYKYYDRYRVTNALTEWDPIGEHNPVKSSSHEKSTTTKEKEARREEDAGDTWGSNSAEGRNATGGGRDVWQPEENRWLISVKTNPRPATRHPRPSLRGHALTRMCFTMACVSLGPKMCVHTYNTRENAYILHRQWEGKRVWPRKSGGLLLILRRVLFHRRFSLTLFRDRAGPFSSSRWFLVVDTLRFVFQNAHITVIPHTPHLLTYKKSLNCLE